jgi:ArsR family transcriptional regulator, arsenate/arsenite/antimonite-responsive transcriptional repressor
MTIGENEEVQSPESMPSPGPVTLQLAMTEPQPARISRPLAVLQPRGPLAEPRVVAETRNLTVEAFRALADPIRLELLALVAAYGPICVCHLEEQLPYSQSRISKHLGTLRRAGLVSSRREGAWVYYETSDEMLAVAHEFLEQLGTSLRTPHEADLCADPDKA